MLAVTAFRKALDDAFRADAKRLLTEHPDCKPWIPRIVLMGGAVQFNYEGKAKPEVEWNVKSDIAAAGTVFNAGVPLLVAPLDAPAPVRVHCAPR